MESWIIELTKAMLPAIPAPANTRSAQDISMFLETENTGRIVHQHISIQHKQFLIGRRLDIHA